MHFNPWSVRRTMASDKSWGFGTNLIGLSGVSLRLRCGLQILLALYPHSGLPPGVAKLEVGSTGYT